MKRLLFLTLLILQTSVFSQSSINSSGGDVLSPEGSVAFSIGIPVYTYFDNDGGSITQGVQHTYDVEEDLSIDENDFLLIKVYPNPSSDLITLELDGVFQYRLFDSKGALIAESSGEKSAQIDMRHLTPAAYFIKVSSDLTTKTFTVIKY
jgi:hypothetical protein